MEASGTCQGVGIVLFGSEVKSCRSGAVSISDGIAEIIDGEVCFSSYSLIRILVFVALVVKCSYF